jgi:hypothetical protein
MKPGLRCLVGMLLMFGLLPLAAMADCPAPATAGVVICQPSPNATIFQLPHFEVAATPVSGSITDIKLSIDGQPVFDSPGPELNLFEGGVANGVHELLVDATDDFGRHYQAAESFTVIGNPPPCPPSGVGVRICAPVANEFVSQNLFFSLGFQGLAAIGHVRVYMDSIVFADFDPPFSQPGQLMASAGSVSAGRHTMKIVAWDIHGRVYAKSVTFNAFFDGGCPPKGNICTPVLSPNTPQDGDDVHSPFRVSAQVLFNPLPITAIKVYLNGQQVAESFGPVFDQTISTAKGTQIMVIQAWDTMGRLYRVTENVNVR